ncbi:MAG: hypothetical protein P8N02_18680 [Actinomycetota bacterium]|jgi:hypothetical protein|nr:hypothetical protein [Actinomycetota bacterium]
MARNDRRSSAPAPSPEELASALSQFNQGVQETRELDRHQKAVNKADRRRKEAAARMKVVLDGEPTAADREAAESEYREAVEEWQRLMAGPGASEAPDSPAGEASEAANAESADDSTDAVDPDAGEDAPAEPS